MIKVIKETKAPSKEIKGETACFDYKEKKNKNWSWVIWNIWPRYLALKKMQSKATIIKQKLYLKIPKMWKTQTCIQNLLNPFNVKC